MVHDSEEHIDQLGYCSGCARKSARLMAHVVCPNPPLPSPVPARENIMRVVDDPGEGRRGSGGARYYDGGRTQIWDD